MKKRARYRLSLFLRRCVMKYLLGVSIPLTIPAHIYAEMSNAYLEDGNAGGQFEWFYVPCFIFFIILIINCILQSRD